MESIFITIKNFPNLFSMFIIKYEKFSFLQIIN